MAMGRRSDKQQAQMFIAISELPATAGHPFYEKLNAALRAIAFDRRVEAACERFYHGSLGRPGIPPGVYFRMLLIGYFEGIDSERGIAWRTADSLSLRRFLGYDLSESTPNHSSLTRVRNRLDHQTHALVFQMVLEALAKAGLVKGRTIGLDATTLEANAAMRSIVRQEGVAGAGQSYEQFLTELAKHQGIDEPTRSDLAKLDKKRPKKGSNDEWKNPHDPDAKITKMKDGRTHLAHKAEHVVDMSDGTPGALLGVSLHGADEGDTRTGCASVEAAFEHVARAMVDQDNELPHGLFEAVVADKGYHSNDVLVRFEQDQGMRTHISEPERGRRKWKGKADAQRAVYANRRRLRRDKGKRLQRERGEKLERSNALMYETGGMRRTHLRTHAKILKRLIVHAAGFNLALLMRALIGIGKPRTLQDGKAALRAPCCRWLALWAVVQALWIVWAGRGRAAAHPGPARLAA